MNYGLDINLLLNILEFLEVNVISKGMIRLGSLILDVMKGYFLDIQFKAKHIDVITKDCRKLWRV